MKAKIILTVLVFSLAFVSCASVANSKGDTFSFNAKILEIDSNYVIVEPLEGEDILRSSDRITFRTGNLNKIDASVGDVVTIRYEGGVRESYPAQITAISWAIYRQ